MESTYSQRSSPSPGRTSSPDTTVTTPDQSPAEDDDIWDSSSDHHIEESGIQYNDDGVDGQYRPRVEMLSDLPALRRQHMTDGYREGLAIGKAKVMQGGFDAGYPLGIELGLRVGRVLGILAGVLAAMNSSKGKGKVAVGGVRAARGFEGSSASTGVQGLEVTVGQAEQTVADGDPGDDVTFVQSLHNRAQEELQVSRLMALIDDEVIAAIPPAETNADGKVITALETQEPNLPPAIEAVVKEWEDLIDSALKATRGDGLTGS
jgi:hypothetical protein